MHLPVLHVVLDLLVFKLATDQSLKAEDSIRRVDNCLPLGRETDETLSVLRESHNRGCCPGTLRVLDDAR